MRSLPSLPGDKSIVMKKMDNGSCVVAWHCEDYTVRRKTVDR